MAGKQSGRIIARGDSFRSALALALLHNQTSWSRDIYGGVVHNRGSQKAAEFSDGTHFDHLCGFLRKTKKANAAAIIKHSAFLHSELSYKFEIR